MMLGRGEGQVTLLGMYLEQITRSGVGYYFCRDPSVGSPTHLALPAWRVSMLLELQ